MKTVETESKSVIDFLKNDFWHYLNQGGVHPSQLSSPQLSLAPGGHSNTNHVEKSLVGQMSRAERATYLAVTIMMSIKDCSDLEYGGKHRSILEAYYIHKLDNRATAIRVGLTDRQYRSAKKAALQEFIERYEFWREKRDCPELPVLYYPKCRKKGAKTS